MTIRLQDLLTKAPPPAPARPRVGPPPGLRRQELPWRDRARRTVEARYNAPGEMLGVDGLYRAGARLPFLLDRLFVFETKEGSRITARAVLLLIEGVPDAAEAADHVTAWREAMLAYKNQPMPHRDYRSMPTFVASEHGLWEIPPEAPKAARTAPTLADQKDALLRKGRDVFGRGVHIHGNQEDGYTYAIQPTTRKHRFRASSFRFTDFDEAHRILDDAITRYTAAIEGR